MAVDRRIYAALAVLAALVVVVYLALFRNGSESEQEAKSSKALLQGAVPDPLTQTIASVDDQQDKNFVEKDFVPNEATLEWHIGGRCPFGQRQRTRIGHCDRIGRHGGRWCGRSHRGSRGCGYAATGLRLHRADASREVDRHAIDDGSREIPLRDGFASRIGLP